MHFMLIQYFIVLFILKISQLKKQILQFGSLKKKTEGSFITCKPTPCKKYVRTFHTGIDK